MLNVPSVLYSGWPPPTTLPSMDGFDQGNRQNVSATTIINNSSSVPLVIDRISHSEKLSTSANKKSYFEKLRSSFQHRRNDKAKSYLTNVATLPKNLLDDMIENLVEPHNEKNTKSQVDILLTQLESLHQIYITNGLMKSIQKEEFERNIDKRSDRFTSPSIITSHGRLLFDFSKQLINDDIYIQLMQFVRLSSLDKLIQKIFHKSGEYYHIDYKENRRNQLQKEQKNRHNSSNYPTHRIYQDSTGNQFSSHPVSSIHNKHQLSNNHNLLSLYQTNFHITMAKAIHFRALSHCFVLDGIDISPRFQYDRNILRNTCLRFHTSLSDGNTLPSPSGIDRMTYERLCSAVHQLGVDSKRTIPFILVLCTQRMRKIYGILELLLKAYISSNISVGYVTFEEIKPFLIKYEPISLETFQKDTTEEDPLNLSPVIDDKIDRSNEECLLDYLRTSSLVLIFMKQLDETYFTALIQWYNDVIVQSDRTTAIEHFWLITSDYQRAQTVFSMPETNLFLWPTEHTDFDHMSIIISSILILPVALSINYEIYTEFISGISIVDKHCQETTMDRNICIKMALLRIWCERKTIGIITYDDDLQHFGEYVQMLHTDYDCIYERKMIPTYVSIHGMSLAKTVLQQISNEQDHFSYDLIAIRNSSSTQKTNLNDEQVPSISPHPSLNDTRITTNANNNLPNRYHHPHASELLTIPTKLHEIEKTLQDNKVSHPHTFILLDHLTPQTIGVFSGIYQMSMFFEKIIRENIIHKMQFLLKTNQQFPSE